MRKQQFDAINIIWYHNSIDGKIAVEHSKECNIKANMAERAKK